MQGSGQKIHSKDRAASSCQDPARGSTSGHVLLLTPSSIISSLSVHFLPFAFSFIDPERSRIPWDSHICSVFSHYWFFFLFNMYSEPFSVDHSTLLNTQVLIILNHFFGCSFKYIFINHVRVLLVMGKNFWFSLFMKKYINQWPASFWYFWYPWGPAPPREFFLCVCVRLWIE